MLIRPQGTPRNAGKKRGFATESFVDYRLPPGQQPNVSGLISAFTFNRVVPKYTDNVGKNFRLRVDLQRPSGLAILSLLPRYESTPHLIMPLFNDMLTAFRASCRISELYGMVSSTPHFAFRSELLFALEKGKEQVCSELTQID